MKVAFDDVAHKGIRNITPEDVAVAQDLGYVVKLVGSIEETPSGIAAEVTPTFLPKAHPLASVNGVMNAVFVESIGIGESMYYGPGAGQKPTATSVVADIVRIVRRLMMEPLAKTSTNTAVTWSWQMLKMSKLITTSQSWLQTQKVRS